MAMAEGKRRYGDFVEALEEERRKIQMFARELPLCLQLVNEAIDNLRWRMESEEGSCERPVFGDFMPGYSSSRRDGELNDEKGASDSMMPDWLRSVQLRGLAAAEEPQAETGTLRKPVAVNARRVFGAFQPFERNKLVSTVPIVPESAVATAVSSSTTTITGERRGRGGELEEEDEERQAPAPTQANRKQRRCWSPDLHRRFLNALEELGGSHLATPKQIREMMKVDRLTNDEVKSHLQKYRLHTRRPVAAVQSSSSNANQSSQHFVLLGSIWVPPHDYLAAAEEQPAEGSNGALNETYFPAASLPLELGLGEDKSAKKQQTNRPSVMPLFSQDDDSLLDDAATKSNSSSASIFSQTTTVSPSL